MSQSNASSSELEPFRNQRVLNLESYRKDGSSVRTPVVFVESEGKLYFQTALKSWKAKRVMRNPAVRIVPSTFRGNPKGEWVNARATRLEGEVAEKARKIYIAKLGFITRFFFLFERLRWGEIGYFSIAIVDSP
jgi:uncharacterized protein